MMMAQLSWSLTLRVVGSSPLAISLSQDPIDVEGVDLLSVKLKAEEKEKIVEVQPSERQGAIRILIIKSSYYDPGDKDDVAFGFSVVNVEGDGQGEESVIRLAGPQVYSGGSVGLFSVAPQKLKFLSDVGKEIDVEIFVARDATPI